MSITIHTKHLHLLLGLITAVCSAMVCLGAESSAEIEPENMQKVNSTYVLNVFKYTAWPGYPFENKSCPIVLGSPGDTSIMPMPENTIDEIEEFDDEFGDLDIEDLMEIEVTSVAGTEQSLMRTPSAIFVITAEDIRRTGHLSIPEVLRLVPGFNVAQVNKSKW